MTTADLVIGANYGDEGKGTITARLAAKHKNQRVVNVLTNGGSQRGHSVSTPFGFHVFKHFGSGTPFGVISYYSKDFILNPLQFCKELSKISCAFKIHIPVSVRCPSCRWSTPFDMMFNQMECKLNWKGTCGMGIWTTIRRYKEMPYIPTFSQFNLMDNSSKTNFLKSIKKYYESKGITILPEYKDAWNSDQLISNFILDCWVMFLKTTESKEDLNLTNYDHVIFENGQGLLLSDEGIDDPEKTPSCTGSKVLKSFDIPDFKDVVVHYVTRPYITRHGSDSFQEEKLDCRIDDSVEINLFNQWQHKFKYSPLDLLKFQQQLQRDSSWLIPHSNVSWQIDITHCDELDRENEFKKVFGNQLFENHGNLNLEFYGNRIIDSE